LIAILIQKPEQPSPVGAPGVRQGAM
jgi:hypothetical protein